MALVTTEKAAPSRHRVIRLSVNQGVLGLAMMVGFTWWRASEAPRVMHELGATAPLLVALLAAFATALSLLKFHLTPAIFVSPAVSAYVAILPLLGPVLSSWIAVLVALLARSLALAGVGPTRLAMDDPAVEHWKLFGLFGTYGLPLVVAGLCYERLGGRYPLQDSSLATAGRICIAALVFMAVNSAVMSRLGAALGYSFRTIARMTLVDTAIYSVALPFTVLVAYCWVGLGLRGLVPLIVTGVGGTIIVRNLAVAHTTNQHLVKRLTSLSQVATVVSLKCERQELLRAVYDECAKVIDVSQLDIALLDESARELWFELEVRDGQLQPRSIVPVGEGLNSWVVVNRKPLLVRSTSEERQHGVQAIDDGAPTESWLGVPMIVQDRLIGVISVQSYRRNAFSNDDIVLLTAIASQAAAAIENSRLYRDLESLAAELEQRVVARTNELEELNLRLVAANRAKSRFLANTSHELRTPLNSIIGFSSILLGRARDLLTPRLYGFLENINVSGTHLLALINDILDLSKVEAGKFELSIAPFDIHTAIASVIRVMKGVAAEANVGITSDVDSRLGEVRLDEARIKEILINLLSNAVKHSPSGDSIRLRVELVARELSRLGCDSMRLVVEDHGPGLTPDQIPRVFEEFYQVNPSSPTARQGTGLGLPLTKRFVELHFGTVEVASDPGVRTTFQVVLPIDAAAHAARAGVTAGAVAPPAA